MSLDKNSIETNKTILVIVESPTKARTIRKFLPKNYIVESCMGHVRDLPQSAKDIPEKYKKESWSRLGVNVDKDFDPIYCVPKKKTKIVSELKSYLKNADELILATDEDREGESISWHLTQVLKPKVPTKRMVFHEITKKAIHEALTQFRDIDDNMVRAQEARRILDRLVGYTISPLLWKKVAYGLSAGRVQSVAVKLISEKEHERIRFKKAQYCGLLAQLKQKGQAFDSKLVEYNENRIAIGKDFGDETGLLKEKAQNYVHLNLEKAKSLSTELKPGPFKVVSVEEKPMSRKPAAPFITSTLQQEANRKLGLSSRDTMQVAQKLYEQGHITYMRTDSTHLSSQAIEAARSCVLELYGKDYLPDAPRDYSKKKVKGAQEAHEAIRPAGTEFVRPQDMKLKGPQLKLYELIWKRTVASQMVNAEQNHVSVKMQSGAGLFSASGMVITFPGFFKAYVEGSDDPSTALGNREVHLPELKVGDIVDCDGIKVTEHETKPPARYTEASLVQKLEKEGVGRPSTYASIISTVQSRGYVKKVGNAMAPTFTALVVSKLLNNHLSDYVDLSFTSQMESSLDEIASGDLDYLSYLKSVYLGDSGLQQAVEKKESEIDAAESRCIELKELEKYSFRVGRYGAYVCKDSSEEPGKELCASIPEANLPADVKAEDIEKWIDAKINGTDAIGQDPDSGKPVYVLTGRYGPYVQLGESAGEDLKPKRTSLPVGLELEDVTLPQALFLLSLPKALGTHPDIQKPVSVGIGRFGPFVVCDGDFRSVPKDKVLFDVNFEDAMHLLAQPKKGRGRAAPLKVLGPHPVTEDEIQVLNGKYGPYIKCGKVNVSLPEGMEPPKVELEFAVELLAPKMSDVKAKAKKKTTKKATKKKVTKKKATKKAKKVTKKS